MSALRRAEQAEKKEGERRRIFQKYDAAMPKINGKEITEDDLKKLTKDELSSIMLEGMDDILEKSKTKLVAQFIQVRLLAFALP
jgi:hypothetical protein